MIVPGDKETRIKELERARQVRVCGRPLDAAGQRRVEDHLLLAEQLAWGFGRQRARDLPVEELLAEAYYGLTYAASLYDATRDVPFGAYATLVIKHRLVQSILMWRRQRKLIGRAIHLDGTAEGDVPAPTTEREASADVQFMCECIRRVLPQRDMEVLWAAAAGASMKEIGRRLGVTRQRVSQIVLAARAYARSLFPDWTRF